VGTPQTENSVIDARITAAFEKQWGFPLEPNLLVLGYVSSHSPNRLLVELHMRVQERAERPAWR